MITVPLFKVIIDFFQELTKRLAASEKERAAQAEKVAQVR